MSSRSLRQNEERRINLKEPKGSFLFRIKIEQAFGRGVPKYFTISLSFCQDFFEKKLKKNFLLKSKNF